MRGSVLSAFAVGTLVTMTAGAREEPAAGPDERLMITDHADSAGAGDGARTNTIAVDGQPVALDALGPVVVNPDGVRTGRCVPALTSSRFRASATGTPCRRLSRNGPSPVSAAATRRGLTPSAGRQTPTAFVIVPRRTVSTHRG